MKVLLTGITGFLGSHLAAALIHRGHEVLGLKRRRSDVARLTSLIDRIQFFDIDDGLFALFENHSDTDLIIHAATAYGHNQEPASDIVAANVLMPLRLLEWGLALRNCAFINTDTFYCKGSDSYKHLSSYSASKKFFLQLGVGLADARNALFCNMQIEHMFGPCDGDKKFTTIVVRQLLDGRPVIKLTPGQQTRDFVFVDDVVDAYMYVIDAIRTNVLAGLQHFEVGSGVAHTIMEFVKLAHRISGSESELSFGGLPYRDDEIMYSRANLEALRALGWSPKVELEAGVRALVRHMRLSAKSLHSMSAIDS